MGCVGAWAGVKKAPSGGLNRVWGGRSAGPAEVMVYFAHFQGIKGSTSHG